MELLLQVRKPTSLGRRVMSLKGHEQTCSAFVCRLVLLRPDRQKCVIFAGGGLGWRWRVAL